MTPNNLAACVAAFKRRHEMFRPVRVRRYTQVHIFSVGAARGDALFRYGGRRYVARHVSMPRTTVLACMPAASLTRPPRKAIFVQRTVIGNVLYTERQRYSRYLARTRL